MDTYKFYIYIIESPSADDIFDGKSEGSFIKTAAELNSMECVSQTVINKLQFIQALENFHSYVKTDPVNVPFLHISCHGNEDGIGLTSNEFIQWHELELLLTPINSSLDNCLVITLSCCNSINGLKMAMHTDMKKPYPFLALVMNIGEPNWSETALGYATFFHLLSNGKCFEDAVAAMCTASGNTDFRIEKSEPARKSFITFLNDNRSE